VVERVAGTLCLVCYRDRVRQGGGLWAPKQKALDEFDLSDGTEPFGPGNDEDTDPDIDIDGMRGAHLLDP